MDNLSMQAPPCFGKGSDSSRCGTCEYREACFFIVRDDRRIREENSRWEGSSSEYIDNIQVPESRIPVDFTENRNYSHDEVVAISAFLLRVGRDRKLGKILTAKLMGAKSFADIARQEGVTRQAIHKRIGKQLAKIFGFKNRRLTDSRLLTLDTAEFNLLKLSRSGFEDEEIRDHMKLSRTEFKKIRCSLDWKLHRPT